MTLILVNQIIDDEFIFYTVASSDGSWQKRGYDSLNVVLRRTQNYVGNVSSFVYFPKSATTSQIGRSSKEHQSIESLLGNMIVQLITQFYRINEIRWCCISRH